MQPTIRTIDDEELTAYFEDPEEYLERLQVLYPKLKRISLGDWVDSNKNEIALRLFYS